MAEEAIITPAGGCAHEHDHGHDHHHDHDHAEAHEHGHSHGCACCHDDVDGDAAESKWEKPLLIGTGVLVVAMLACEWLFRFELGAQIFAGLAILGGLALVAPAAWEAIRAKSIDITILMFVAAAGALYVGSYEEAAAVLFLFSIGEYLEDTAMRKSGSAIEALAELAPDTALVQRAGEIVEVATDRVTLGEIIQVKPGMSAPLDGIIIEGSSNFNDAAVTGESVPVRKAAGDTVYAASVSVDGSVLLRTTTTVADSTVAKIATLVADARKQKSERETFVKRFAKIYTPIVVLLAALVVVVPTALLYLSPAANLGGSLDVWIYRACELLLISCPCAFVISTPVTFVSALARAARTGVLVKGGAFFERGAEVSAVAFDKTGTLTKGDPQVVFAAIPDGAGVEPGALSTGDPAAEMLAVAAAIESHSTHPLGAAICRSAEAAGLGDLRAADVTERAGRGIDGVIDGVAYSVGSQRMAHELGIDDAVLDRLATQTAGHRGTNIFVVRRDAEPQVAGVLVVADALRDDAVDALAVLGSHGIERIMLTGDNAEVARDIADKVGIDRVFAECMPADKTDRLNELRSTGVSVAFVGDGINDAPSLAAADVGIAMGGAGSDAALESADVVLMADDLSALPKFFTLSRKASRTLKQNVWMAIGLKVAAMVLVVMGLLPMWVAIFADTGVMLLVVANGMMLLRARL